MLEWNKRIQEIVDRIDVCINNEDDDALTLKVLAQGIGYSEYYNSRMFSEISGMTLKDYLRYRKLASALKEVRDSGKGILISNI